MFPYFPSSRSRSPPSPFSLIQTEANCINCVSVCIKREKIVYIHASTYILVLYTYSYTIKILPCPISFTFLSFSFYTIFKLYLISLSLILYISIQLHIPCQISFIFLFLILHKFKLYIIVLYTCNNTIGFINFVFIQFSVQVSFSFLFYTLRFI